MQSSAQVVGMIEKVETECSELVHKLQSIENDKKKIEVRDIITVMTSICG